MLRNYFTMLTFQCVNMLGKRDSTLKNANKALDDGDDDDDVIHLGRLLVTQPVFPITERAQSS
ncbi:hypothetical protein E2C01_073687 [Portunus trituberculatus]|uniref:Uncharacterized protein n=1 Tax=Portunus trituberculatus TaxID=210409 RepID=A0A5B7IA34_PORTR|nr:hypothetical protein [Portunus trituberculatus]